LLCFVIQAKRTTAIFISVHHGDHRDMLGHVQADLIMTSPPYNIGSRSERMSGFRKDGKFDPKSFGAIRGYADSLPEDLYQDSQITFLRWCAEHLTPDGTVVYNHKLRRRDKQIIHPMTWIMRVPELVLVEEIVWDRGSTHNHDKTMMWPQTERLFVLRLPRSQYCLRNVDGLPQRSDIWRIGRAPNLGHCAPFPLALAEAAILAWSKPDQLVCDPYLGSGTSAVAAHNLGRRFEGAEILRNYYDMAMTRLNTPEDADWLTF
jgi:site-specific DNA-methyltransferase (adenine-specific)